MTTCCSSRPECGALRTSVPPLEPGKLRSQHQSDRLLRRKKRGHGHHVHDWMFPTGILLLVTAVVGGGVKVFSLEIPLLKSVKRQVLLALVGLMTLGLGILLTWLFTLIQSPELTLAPGQAPMGTAPQRVLLGGLDLNRYCMQFGYFEAYPSRPGSVYDGWRCRGSLPGGADKDIHQAANTIDLKAACEWQYADVAARGQLEARAERPGDPGSWRCDLVW